LTGRKGIEEDSSLYNQVMQALETNESIRYEDGKWAFVQYDVMEYITRLEKAKKLLESTYNNRFRDRYDGSLTGWLIPYCRPGFTAKIKDLDFEERISFYYVDSVVSEFSESGGKRTVKLGFRVG
jgi:hypothetical protein